MIPISLFRMGQWGVPRPPIVQPPAPGLIQQPPPAPRPGVGVQPGPGQKPPSPVGPLPPRPAVPPGLPAGLVPAIPGQPAPQQAPAAQQDAAQPTSPAPSVPSCCRTYWNPPERMWYMACASFDRTKHYEGPADPVNIAHFREACAGGPAAAAAPPPGAQPPGLMPPPTGAMPPGFQAPLPPNMMMLPRPAVGPPPGVQPTGAPGAEPSAVVSPDEAARLLGMADTAKGILEGALARAAAEGATDADRAAAAEVTKCVDALVRDAGPLAKITEELRSAASAKRPARITASQARAIETFASCAAATAAAGAPRGGILEAVAGIGLPAAGALLIAL